MCDRYYCFMQGEMIELKNKIKNRNQILMGNTWCYPIIAIGRGKSSSTYNKNVQKNGISLYNRWKINQFAISYIINPILHINQLFIEQVEKCSRATFHENTMKTIRDVMKNKDVCVIALIIFYDIKTKNPIKVYRVLSCVLYSLK